MLKLEFNPTQVHLSEIRSWLKEECDKSNEGFYCNWYIIKRCFEEEQLIVGLYNNMAIGFITYNQIGSKLMFDIMEVEPLHRNKGFGKKLLIDSIKHFKDKDIIQIEVDCINVGSEIFCTQIGFTKANDPYSQLENGFLMQIN